MKTDAQDDTGSLMVAVLISVVGMLMSAVLATVVLSQITTTRNMVQRQHAVDAALAGLDIATGQLRGTRADAAGNGVLSSLPCGPFTGSVGIGGVATYTVAISYVSSAGTPLACLAGKGVVNVPAVANLVSVGVDRPGDPQRTLQATYLFRTTNQNIAGGQIHVFRVAGYSDLCMDAGSATPAAGTPVTVQPCDSGSPQETFAYNTDLTLELVSSASGSQPDGMCLDGGPVPHTVNNAAVTFQPCTSTTQPRQQWSYNDSANFEGTSDGKTVDLYCFNVQTVGLPGSPIVLRTGNNHCFNNAANVSDNEQSFSPDGTVGAGAASAASLQLVNYKEFGRCLDVTAKTTTSSYLVIWPCKQAPDGNIGWNQKWQLPIFGNNPSATGGIRTQPTGSPTWCLVSPLVVAAGAYVTLQVCSATDPVSAAMTWTAYGNTGVYATSYTITDSRGNCLAPTDPNAPNPDLVSNGGNQISKAVVVNCSGSTLEKWNAQPYVLQASPLKNIGER